MKKLFLFALLSVISFAAAKAQTEPYTPRWRGETVYPKNFNTWWFWIGYNSADSTGCPAPYYTYGDVQDQACRIVNWDTAPSTEGVYYARIRIQPFNSSEYVVRWPWKWYSSATGATYYFLSRTP